MRETPLSNCERDFIKKAVADKRRIDGRQAYDYRHLKVSFGVERGCCQVEIGETRVMSQVSCQVIEPKQVRPADGMLHINVELSPMACPSFEAGRLSDFGVEINRLLERCLKESRCVDTESLCIVAGEKVWEVRVDVHALNHDGNLIDACSIAAIASLAHFRRPDITVSGDEITIHPASERDPVPLSVHHMPICVSFAFFEQGKFLLVDPTDKEEKVMDGRMVIGMNKHREICTLQITGQMLLLKDQVLRCSNIAVVKVTEITELIHKALENDRLERTKGGKFGFAETVCKEKLTTNQKTATPLDMDTVEGQMATEYLDGSNDTDFDSEVTSSEDNSDTDDSVVIMDSGVGSIGVGGKSTWNMDDEMEELKHEETNKSTQKSQKTNDNKPATGADNLGDSSEEETTEILGNTTQKGATDSHRKKKRKS